MQMCLVIGKAKRFDTNRFNWFCTSIVNTASLFYWKEAMSRKNNKKSRILLFQIFPGLLLKSSSGKLGKTGGKIRVAN